MTITRGWPPVYDFDTLALQIKDLISNQGIFQSFYSDDSSPELMLCQGDVVQFCSPFPVVDSDGDISTLEEGYSQWLIVGNTCDLDRDIKTLDFTHISPLVELDDTVPSTIISGLKSYNSYKKFYLPSWNDSKHPGYILDFTKMCSVHKSFLFNQKQVFLSARMSYLSWLLFNSCIVRYFARDDGRNT